MIAFIWYISLLFFALNGLIFVGQYNRKKYAELIVLEHSRHYRRRRHQIRGRR